MSSSFFNFQMMMASRLAMLPEHLQQGTYEWKWKF